MNYSEMIKSLYKLGKKGSKLDLKRITTACTHFNNPQNNLKIIHIAGTNGKGSVAAMLDSILREAGYSVGLYTSPHLIDFRERIQINREKIPKEDFLRLFEKINQANLDITFFEFTTLLALLYFQEKQPDYVILEVGLGGRLDATNICSPILSVITNISIDHQEYLGNTLESITKEKCGIIKIVPVFTCQQEPIILDTIKKACSDKRLPLTITNDYKERISLLGDFQKQNAGLAESVARSLELTDEKISQGLKHVSWPGRIDYLEPQLLVDGAHNASGIKALSNYVSSLNKNIIIIFGVSEGKNHKEMIAALPKYKHLIITRAEINRAISPDDISVTNSTQEPNITKALEKARSLASNEDIILVTGSLYLIGDLMKHLSGKTDPTINEFI